MALRSRGLSIRLALIVAVLVASALFSTSTAMAASGWEFIDPEPAPESMFDVDALDATHVVAVGKDGQILRSEDSGANWSFVPSGVTRDLLAVDFVDSSTGWAVGDYGVVLSTTDGGATWISQTSESDVILKDVSFSDANHGWAVGWPNVVMRTADGGVTWAKVDLGVTFGSFTAVDSPNADLCVIAPGLNVTRDGGLTWAQGTGVSGRFIEVVDSLNWFVTSYPSDYVSITHDGGATWSSVLVIPGKTLPRSNEANYGLYQIEFSDSLHGWVKPSGTGLAKTSDGGATWVLVEPRQEGSRVVAPHTGEVAEMATWGDQQLWIVGYDRMARTSDGGSTWTDSVEHVQLLDVPNAFNGVAFADRRNGWLVGRAGTILRTTDNGDSWTLQSSGVTETVSTIACLDSGTAIAGTYGGTILRTSDGGVTWTKQLQLPRTIEFYDIAVIDSSHAVIDGGWSYRTEDAGLSWTQILPTEVKWTGTTMSVRNGAVYSSKGYSTDNGMTWRAYGASPSANAVNFLDSDNGWAVGAISGLEGCLVRKTANGGASWTTQSVPAHERATDIKFVDDNNWWIIGGRGMILRTSDGGATWSRQRSAATGLWQDACFVDSQYGWITGTLSSAVMRTTTGGSPAAAPYSTTLSNGVRLEFDSVLDQGRSTAIESGGQTAPPNFRILRGNYYEISTSAQFTGFVNVTIPYNESDLHGLNESNLKLMHWKNNGWEDITVSVDTASNTITGRTDSFSPFAVMGSTGSSSEVSTPASSWWSLGMMIGLVCVSLIVTTSRGRMRVQHSTID